MPYLHWDTDRQRENIAQFLDKENMAHYKEKETAEHEKKMDRQAFRGDLVIPDHKTQGKSIQWRHESQVTLYKLRTLPTIVFNSVNAGSENSPKIHKTPVPFEMQKGRILAHTRVGQVLFDAAMLYEAMTIYRDKKFIHKYLYKDPPLHPRRTLDQAYYWTLKTTRARDRDQVVYRGTRPTLEHSIDVKEKKWNCPKKRLKSEQSEDSNAEKDGSYCVHCRSDIRKVSRLLMVDQLWMWILDEKTIITAFPKRYGVNKPDSSGVHKSIRSRLKNLRQDHIKTVFDLALIILDECSKTFFDRTKTAVSPHAYKTICTCVWS